MIKEEELQLDYLKVSLINKINGYYSLLKNEINNDKIDLRLTLNFKTVELDSNIRFLTQFEKKLNGIQHSYSKKLQHLFIDLYNLNKLYYYSTIEVLYYTTFKDKYTKKLVKPMKEYFISKQDQI